MYRHRDNDDKERQNAAQHHQECYKELIRRSRSEELTAAYAAVVLAMVRVPRR